MSAVAVAESEPRARVDLVRDTVVKVMGPDMGGSILVQVQITKRMATAGAVQ